ncbi:MAG: hypothetical protein L3J82_06775 [Planctomycetes bacterium]|nr:hypothetical protein [Planctomycetota bacterium]
MTKKQPIVWWRLWPVLVLAGFAAEQFYTEQTTGRPVDWFLVGLCIAGAVAVVWIRIGRRIG